MSEVVSLSEAREKRQPHVSGEAVCLDCRHTWVAVVPLGVIWMECPSCSLQRGRFKFQHVCGKERHWVCHCGNDLFHVTTERTYCPNCGQDQEGHV